MSESYSLIDERHDWASGSLIVHQKSLLVRATDGLGATVLNPFKVVQDDHRS